MKLCPFCSNPIEDNDLFCTFCGKSLPYESMPHLHLKCSHCDVEYHLRGVIDDVIVCGSCENELEILSIKCPYCENELQKEDRTCGHCGREIGKYELGSID